MIHRFLPLLALIASPVAAQSWEREALGLHNRERAAWRVAPLAWDPGLAASADRWAAELARTNRWGHSPRSWRPGQGENLWMGIRGGYSLAAMVGSWIDERRYFRPGIFPYVTTTRNWVDVGHYTQLISSRSLRVGCAMRSSGSWTYFVCRYWPSGNVDGRSMP